MFWPALAAPGFVAPSRSISNTRSSSRLARNDDCSPKTGSISCAGPQGQGVLLLVAELLLDDDRIVEAATEPATPCSDRKTLLTLLLLELDRLSFSAPVVEVTLRVVSAAPGVAEQGRLFARRQQDPHRLRRTLARLQALFGHDSLSRLSLKAVHRPEEQTVEQRPGALFTSNNPRANAGELVSSLRLIDPPRPVQVRLRTGRIDAFRLSGQPSQQVRLRFGPRRLSGGWWEKPFDRDYFQVATSERGLFWLFRDRLENRWYLHGVFD